MKISTGSSSSSVASDSLSRKSTLCIYTEGDYVAAHEKPDCGSQAMELRRELDSVQRALHLQSETVLRQRHQMVELTQKLAVRNDRAAGERMLRESQLSAVLRSLYLLEARLKKEQAVLENRLCQRDTIIKWQKEEIFRLKGGESSSLCVNCQKCLKSNDSPESSLTSQSSENIKLKYKPNLARSNSYNERQGAVFQKNSRLSKSFHLTKNGQDGEVYTSSSEENGRMEKCPVQGNYIKNKQAFVRKDVTRRSRKYSGRKHNSIYLGSIQKHTIDQTGQNSSTENMTDRQEDTVFVSSDDGISDKITQDIERASFRIDELLQRTGEGWSSNGESEKKYTDAPSESFACKIESLHGIKQQNAKNTISCGNFGTSENGDDNERPWYMNTSDPEPELDFNYVVNKGKLCESRSKSADNLIVEAYSEDILNKSVVSTTNEVLCKAAFANKPGHPVIISSRSYNEKHTSRQRSNNENKTTNKGNNNEKRVKFSCRDKFSDKFANETNENWYASVSDHEDGPPCEIYKNNPVLECVNQILLQNSLDESSNEATTSPQASSPKTNSKRVQFSTLNSISFDENAGNNGSANIIKEYLPITERRSCSKIVKFSLETASEHSYEVPKTAEGFNYEVQSIYSNDYEPVITRNNDINCREVDKRPIPLPRSVHVGAKIPGDRKHSSVVKCMASNLENKQPNPSFAVDGKYDETVVPLKIINKRKVPRTPPALPPKPKNLASKFKLERQNNIDLNMNALGPYTPAKSCTVSSSNSSIRTEPDYCSISEINVPVVCGGKREIILSQPTVEIHVEKQATVKATQESLVSQINLIKSMKNRISDKDIPKLPQVTEIIIPEDDDDSKDREEDYRHDNYISNAQLVFDSSMNKVEHRNSIQIGNSVSSILSELNRGSHTNEINKNIALSELDGKYSDLLVNTTSNSAKHNTSTKHDAVLLETLVDDVEKFDLSQNFEEFKIDECEFDNLQAEEYKISSEGSDTSSGDGHRDDGNFTGKINHTVKTYRIEFTPDVDFKDRVHHIETKLINDFTQVSKVSHKNCNKMSNKPDLLSNIDSIETDSVRNSDIESSNSSGSNSGSYNTVKYEPGTISKDVLVSKENSDEASFEYFLESSGLSSKDILTPSKPPQLMRPPNSNHKTVTKPKDIKARTRNNINTNNKPPDKPLNTTAIKYFEPYL